MTLLVRHQIGSLTATMVDFVVMIACVTFAGLGPGVGAAIGAGSGGIVNFFAGRSWIFRAQSGSAGSVGGQALRYALVSVTSLLLNGIGEHVLAGILHLQYVAARVCVALVVSVTWNFPMQRRFVFRAAGTRVNA